jgi:tight adherence protein C
MNGHASLVLAGCLCALASGLTAVALVRGTTFLRYGQRDAAMKRLPWMMRICAGPAEMLRPLVSLFVGRHWASRLERKLDSLDLCPPLDGKLWIGIRAVHGLLLASLVAVFPGAAPPVLLLAAVSLGYCLGGMWLRQLQRHRDQSISRELPAYLDLMTVCVEAGATLTSGVRLIVAQSPDTPLRSYFERVLREVRSGRPRAEAFSHVAGVLAVAHLSALAAALSAAEAAGLSLGEVLRTQAAQRTAERFAHAEKLAMQAPVKMLAPLILCIFPCTFIVLAVPIAVRLQEAFAA